MERLRTSAPPSRVVQPNDLIHTASSGTLLAADGGALDQEALSAVVGADDPTLGAWVVARRATSVSGLVPVGIRGETRQQRYPALLPVEAIDRVLRPWDIPLEPSVFRRALPAFSTLPLFAAEVQVLGVDHRWGPGGSVGFELATGRPVVTGASDLDILIDAPRPLDLGHARTLLDATRTAAARIDVQVLAPHGGFSLTEWVREQGARVALRTEDGPLLTDDPWGSGR